MTKAVKFYETIFEFTHKFITPENYSTELCRKKTVTLFY